MGAIILFVAMLAVVVVWWLSTQRLAAKPWLEEGPIGSSPALAHCLCRQRRSDYSGVRLTGRIAGFFEEVPAFVGAEQGADVAQGGPERLERARRRLAQERFDLGERHLDWVQIRRVLREEQEPGAARLERRCGAGALVDREIVRDHDVAGPKGRGELGLDIGVECRAVHGAIHHPRGGEPITPERSDEGLGAPAAERRRGAQALSATAAPTQPRHLRVNRGLVDEHQTCRLKPHAGLTLVDPLPSSLPDIGAFALRRHQLFFYR